jgi:hypothetical protein
VVGWIDSGHGWHDQAMVRSSPSCPLKGGCEPLPNRGLIPLHLIRVTASYLLTQKGGGGGGGGGAVAFDLYSLRGWLRG